MSIGPNAPVTTAKSMPRALLRRAAGRGWPRLGQGGNAAIWMALTLPVIVAFSGLGVDLSYVYFQKEKLQAIANAACLAGSMMLPNDTTAVTTALSYGNQNTPSGYGTVLRTADVVPGTWSSSTRSFTANASPSSTSNDTALRCTVRRTTANGNPVPLFFGPIVGWRTMDITRRATASYGTAKAWDVTIVQDVSSSFSTQIANSRNADLQLLGCQTGATSSSSQFGLTAMTGHYTNLRPMTSLGTASNVTDMKAAINSLAKCGTGGMPACSGSNMAAGLYGALQNFKPTSQPGGTYVPSSSLFGKAVVLVTDGAPNASSTTYTAADGVPSGTTSCPSGKSCTDADLLSWAKTQSAALGAQQISLYIVYYTGGSGGSSGLANLQSILASNTFGGKLYNTPTATQLSTVMNNVCSVLPHALVD
ncbi:MAG: hypothetical protein QOK29_366 [Rhodospirillaceae bacterium]|nr:hypothetical protein [Rhodospirillaceae bacterium]